MVHGEVMMDFFPSEIMSHGYYDDFASFDLTPPESPEHLCSFMSQNIEDGICHMPDRFSPSSIERASVLWSSHMSQLEEVRGDWTAPPTPTCEESDFSDEGDLLSWGTKCLQPLINNAAIYVDFKPSACSFDLQPSCIPESTRFMEEPLELCRKRKTRDRKMKAAPMKVTKFTPVLKASTAHKALLHRRSQREVRREDPSPEPADSEDPDNKRHTHNVLERKRRNELKSSYADLREVIPGLAENDKAPTGFILNRACEFINELLDEERNFIRGIAQLRTENNRLRKMFA